MKKGVISQSVKVMLRRPEKAREFSHSYSSMSFNIDIVEKGLDKRSLGQTSMTDTQVQGVCSEDPYSLYGEDNKWKFKPKNSKLSIVSTKESTKEEDTSHLNDGIKPMLVY